MDIDAGAGVEPASPDPFLIVDWQRHADRISIKRYSCAALTIAYARCILSFPPDLTA
ncbi:hypothetical protein BCAR13_1140014 [Paraburkholderia caribensis]|nr:hypothetical protein BCAR13_1140014 [Paraburkholderia caribensis]